MLVLILQTCGLDDMVSSIDFDNVCESLEEMLDGLTEVNSRQATPLIIDPKSTGQCSGRLRQFLASVISDDFPFMKDLLLLEQFRSWLVLLTK